MKKVIGLLSVMVLLASCSDTDDYQSVFYDNPEISLNIPVGFPDLNNAFTSNKPTKYGVALGEKLFSEKKFSTNNSISCASCHIQENAFGDKNAKAIGILGRVGLRNTPPIQNLAFMKFYNWDGSKLQLEKQSIVPIITHEEMNSSIMEVISKIRDDSDYKNLFLKTFGDDQITPERIFKSIAQYEYTLISANSTYDKIQQNGDVKFSESEARGYQAFQQKCVSCHSTGLFTDQSFRNIGFPLNPNTEEAGRARVTGIDKDYMSYRVPTLRNIEYTAPYGSFGQFASLKEVLDYFDTGVLIAANLDPILKNNGNRIPLTELEKLDLIAFMKTLTDKEFLGRK